MWVIHPNYNNLDFVAGDDIALIRITAAGLTFSERVGPVCKPTVYPAENAVLTVMGWGLTETGSISNILKTVSYEAFG